MLPARHGGNSSYKIILKQSAKEFAKYNQLYPDQFLPLQRDMIGKFGAAKDQWFSSFLLQVENHSSLAPPVCGPVKPRHVQL